MNYMSMQIPATTCVLLGFLPVFYKEVYHIFLQTVEMGIHQPCSDVHSGVSGKEKKENHGALHGHLQEFDFAIKLMNSEKCAKADLFLSIYCWINRGEQCRLPLLACIYKLTPAGPGLICCERKHLLQGVITPATSSYVSGNCTLLGRKPK